MHQTRSSQRLNSRPNLPTPGKKSANYKPKTRDNHLHSKDRLSDGSGSVSRLTDDSIGEMDGRFERLRQRLPVRRPGRRAEEPIPNEGSDLGAEDRLSLEDEGDIQKGSELQQNKSFRSASRSGSARTPNRGWGSKWKEVKTARQYSNENSEVPINKLLCQEEGHRVGQNNQTSCKNVQLKFQNTCSDDDHEMLSVLSGIKSTNTVILEAQSIKSTSQHSKPLRTAPSVSGKENEPPKYNLQAVKFHEDPESDEFEEPRPRIPLKHSNFVAKCIKTPTDHFKAIPIPFQPLKQASEIERNSCSSQNTLSEYLEPSKSKVSQISVEGSKSDFYAEPVTQQSQIQQQKNQPPIHDSRDSQESRKSLKPVASGSAAVYPECMLEYVVPINLDNPDTIFATEFSEARIKFHDSDRPVPKEENTAPNQRAKSPAEFLFNEVSAIHSSGDQSSFYSIKLRQKGTNAWPGRKREERDGGGLRLAERTVERNIFHDWASEDRRSRHTAATLPEGQQQLSSRDACLSVPPVGLLPAVASPGGLVVAPGLPPVEEAPVLKDGGVVGAAALVRAAAVFLGLSKMVGDGVRRLMPRATDRAADGEIVGQAAGVSMLGDNKSREMAIAARGMLPSGMRFEEYSLGKLVKAWWAKAGLAASVCPDRKKSLKAVVSIGREVLGLHMISEAFVAKTFELLRKGEYDSALELILTLHGTKLQVPGEILTDGRILPAELLLLLLCATIKENASGDLIGQLNDKWCQDIKANLTKILWSSCKYFKLGTSTKIISQLMRGSIMKAEKLVLEPQLPRETTPPKIENISKNDLFKSQAENLYSQMMDRPKCETRLAIVIYILTSSSKIYKNQLFLSQPTILLKDTLRECAFKAIDQLRTKTPKSSSNTLPLPSTRALDTLLPSKIASVLSQCQNSLSTQTLKLVHFGLQRQRRHKNLKKHYFGTDETAELLTKQETRINEAYAYCHETLGEFLTRAPTASFETLQLFVLSLFVLFRDLAQDREDIYAALWNALAECWRTEICQGMLIVLNGKHKEELCAGKSISGEKIPTSQTEAANAKQIQQPKFRDWLELTLENNLSLGVSVADIWKFVSHHCDLRAPVEPFDVEVRKSNMDLVRECAISQMVHRLISLGRLSPNLRQYRVVQVMRQLRQTVCNRDLPAPLPPACQVIY